ncbi:MAG: hypothetical protein M1836_008079 [Candelina mexicana]|nr:MAG: hypothetical protein M1836_008079 [Candelina mexicana]
MSYASEKAGEPAQGLAHRGTGGSSMDDAIPDQDPGDTSRLLLERLQAWKHACGYLENYISATEKIHRAHSKEYEKLLKTVSDPLKEGHHFEQNLGGIAGLFENVRSNTQAIANSHLETEKNLKGSVLPILARLHTEIKHKNKELSGGAAKGSKAVDKARNLTQKHIELLGQSIGSFTSTGGKVEPSHDPYILQKGVEYRLHRQILEENNNREDLLAVQNSFKAFESHIIQTIQQAMSSFRQIVGAQADTTKHMYSDMDERSTHIPLDFEWNGFVKRNSNILIDPREPQRSMSNVNFPNQNHHATQPLIAGSLERKSRVIKTYSNGYYVVTPAKYLHEFKDDDHIRKDPTPELSLYLPDCVVGAANGALFNVKGKDVSKGKVGGALSMTHELAFKAHTPADAEKWWEVLRAAAGQNPSGNVGFSEPSSLVAHRQTSGTQPPAYAERQPAPVQTQGLQQQQQQGYSATPHSATPHSAGGVGQHDYAGPQSATTSGVPQNTPLTSAPTSAGPGAYTAGPITASPTATRMAPGQEAAAQAVQRSDEGGFGSGV